MKEAANWSEVTVGMYQALMLIDKSQQAIEQEIQLLSILSGREAWVYECLPINELKDKIAKTSFLGQLPTGNGPIPKTLKFADKKYSVNLKINDLSGGQYIDLMTLTKDSAKITERLHEILAIFIHPMERKYFMWFPIPYSGLKHREVADDIKKHLPMSIAYPIALFFCLLYENSISGIQDYFLQQSQREMLKAKLILLKDMRKSKKKKTATSKNGDGL